MQLRAFPVIDRPVDVTPELTVITVQAPPAWTSWVSLLKPQKWLLPMVAMGCGLSGPQALSAIAPLTLVLALLLVGPLLTGTGHVVNAFFDRHGEAFRDQDLRPPAFRLTSDAIVALIGVLSLLSLLVAHQLGSFAFNVTAVTLAIDFALNAPPFRLRRQAWWNGLFFGVVAVGGPWVLGETLVGTLSQNSTVLACIFGFGAVGLQLVGSLHRSRGERMAGLQTLAALFGPEVGAGMAAMIIDTSLLGAAIVCFGTQETLASGLLMGTLGAQLGIQLLGFRFPRLNRVSLSILSMGLYMTAMLVAATSTIHSIPQF